VTADEANALASSLQGVTRYSDEEIMAAETMLLQFETMNAQTFPVATQLALDLATRLGTDAAGAAQMLGKALAEPGEGLLRLKTAGVTFTDQEEEQIKAMYEAGNVAGAQAAIMDKLQASLGGAATAAGETFAGKMDILKNQMSDIKERIGAAVLPALSTLAGKFQEALADPRVQEGIKKVADWLAVNLPIAIEAVSNWIQNTLIPAVREMVRWIREEAVPWVVTFWGKVLEFRDKVVAAWGEVQSGWENLKGAIMTGKQNIETFLTNIKTWFTDIRDAVQGVIDKIAAFLTKLKNLADAIIPDWLQGKSPPPMAEWLADIAGASFNAKLGLAGVGGSVQSMPAMTQMRGGGGNSTTNNSVGGDTFIQNITDPVSMALAMALVNDRKRDRWNAAMGVAS